MSIFCILNCYQCCCNFITAFSSELRAFEFNFGTFYKYLRYVTLSIATTIHWTDNQVQYHCSMIDFEKEWKNLIFSLFTFRTFLSLIGNQLPTILKSNNKIGIAVVSKYDFFSQNQIMITNWNWKYFVMWLLTNGTFFWNFRFFELLSLIVQKHTSPLVSDVLTYTLSQVNLILLVCRNQNTIQQKHAKFFDFEKIHKIICVIFCNVLCCEREKVQNFVWTFLNVFCFLFFVFDLARDIIRCQRTFLSIIV